LLWPDQKSSSPSQALSFSSVFMPQRDISVCPRAFVGLFPMLYPILSLEHLWKSLTVTPPEKPRGKPKKVTPIREVPTADNAATKGDRP
jgi:hypothetical protein